MRVMMIAPYPRSPQHIDGGVAAASLYLSQALAGRPDVELVGVRMARDGRALAEDDSLGWPVADLPLGRLSLSTVFWPQRRRLRELIRRFDPQVVHAQGADLAGLLAVTSGRAAVVTAHGMLAECARLQTDPVNRMRAMLSATLTERPTIRRTRHLIAISPYVVRHYGQDIAGRIHNLPNAIGPAFFNVRRHAERGRILYAGRIANGKGLEDLIGAVADSGTAVTQLILAGATPDRDYGRGLMKKVRTLGIESRTRFAGLLSETELLLEFARAEALVLPSHQETAPMVVQQAMAAGLAVIATCVGGIPDQISHEVSGLLFDAGNIRQLTSLLGRLASDETLGAFLGSAAREIAAVRYRADAIAAGTVEVYRKAFDANGADS